MAGRVSPLVLTVLGMLTGVALTGIVMVASTASADTRPPPVTTATAMAAAATPPPPQVVAQPPAPAGERQLDTNVPVPRAAQPTTYAPQVAKLSSDEHLPSWVPVRGRLSVVGSNDLAENLGLVPAGTTKKMEGRITVAEALAQNGANAPAVAAPSPRGATWVTRGHVRHGRR